MITWIWSVSVYLWLAGMAGGAYCAAFLTDRFSGRNQKELLRIATWFGFPLLVLGLVMLTFELGQPVRLWHLFTEFFALSPMSTGSWLLLAWTLVAAALIALWFAEARAPEGEPSGLSARVASWLRPLLPVITALTWIQFVLSALLIAYTGVLLSATNQPLWSTTWLLPALFVVSSMSTGIAALMLVLLLRKRNTADIVAYLGRADVFVYVLELVTLVLFLVALGSARNVLVTGTLGAFFWVGAVLIGMLVPLGLGLWAMARGKENILLSLLATSWAIAGGLVLRDVIVLGGQIYG